MNETCNTPLEAKVAARNSVHEILKVWGPKFLEAARGFQGKQIRLASGARSAKWNKAVTALIEQVGGSFQCWVETTWYSLRVCFKVSRTYPLKQADHSGAQYAEASLNIGGLNGGMLFEVPTYESLDGLRTDYTAQEVLKLREEHKAADEVRRQLESKLCHFGHHDNF